MGSALSCSTAKVSEKTFDVDKYMRSRVSEEEIDAMMIQVRLEAINDLDKKMKEKKINDELKRRLERL
jgi:hypothetical protein